MARKQLTPPNKHLIANLKGVNEKANAFLATSHKGAWSNGMTLIMEINKKYCIIQRPHGFNAGRVYVSKSPTLTANKWQDNNMLMENIKYISGVYRTHKVDGGFRKIKSGKAACVPARAREDGSGQNVVKMIYPDGKTRIRRMTPTECARMQTVPDWYKFVVSETQQYKMLGNGWTVDVIKHIFSFISKDVYSK